MKLKGELKLNANVKATLRDAKTGRIKEVSLYHNVVPTIGRTAIANAMTDTGPSPGALVTYCEVGTGITTPATSDIALTTPLFRATVASRSNDGNIAYVTGFFPSTEANGNLKEAGLFCGGTATAGTGSMISHVLVNITKSVSETLTIEWLFQID